VNFSWCLFSKPLPSAFALRFSRAVAIVLALLLPPALTPAAQAQALLMPGGLWFAIHAVPILKAEFGKSVL
jgi:hypothetical protein